MSTRTASVWLGGFGGFCAALLAALGALEGWDTAARFTSIIALNAMLSPDNLVVFMMFLKHAGLPARHQRRVISDGLLLAASSSAAGPKHAAVFLIDDLG